MDLSNILNIVVCAVIIILALGIMISMRKTARGLEEIRRNFTDTGRTSSIRRREQVSPPAGFDAAVKTFDTGWYAASYDIDNLEKNRERFNELYAGYVSASQMVSIFPLLGILGTILGLVVGSGSGDVDAMIAGLGTALYTTLLGLVASIILKLIDARTLGKNVNLIDGYFARVDAEITNERLAKELKVAMEAEYTRRGYRSLDDFARQR